jgi:hypothetical protein
MTLIEVLIATALTLVIMLALAQGFKTLSQGVTAGRARLTGSDQLRGLSSLLRADLSGMTANIRQLPQTQQAANGYFMYYDGPLSDSTAMLFNYVPGAPTNEEKLSASRWSDIDDVLMFTAKAKDGQWFRGRVPLALLKIHQRNVTGNNAIQPTLQDWLTDVSVASEYAEIAWFMRPLNDLGSVNVGETGGGYGFTPPASPVIDTAPGADRSGDGIPDPDGMPDRVALCRRVFLIRPDLDITADPGVNLPSDQQLAVQPLDVDSSSIDSFRYQMRFVYQRCDLSVRPLLDTTRGAFVVRTNSLADLQIPENRFAHYVVPVDLNIPTANPIGPATTLPHLALTSEGEPSAANYLSMITLAYGAGILPIDRGFIPAAFFRTKIDADSNGNIISARPTLEEVVASNVVGFDVRGYDGMVQQLASTGVDGAWGASGFDDNGANGIDDLGEAGWPGTDDLVVSPSDPGYALQINANVLIPQNSGAFVDLCWGRRVLSQLAQSDQSLTIPGGVPALSALPVADARRALFSTPLSGFDSLIGGGAATPVSTMLLAGRFSTIASVYQPTFDTFTNAYEADGNRQLSGFSANGLIRFGGTASTNNPGPDQGIDGLDNNNNGAVDEELEQETRPPIVYEMPSIQIKFRIQDVPAGTLQELSIVHDLTGK